MTLSERDRPDEGYEDSHWESIARFSEGSSDPAEAEQVRARLGQDRADAELLALLDQTLPPVPKWDISLGDIEGALQKVSARRARLGVSAPRLHLVHGTPVRRRWAPLPVAAAAAAALVAFTAIWPRLRGEVEDPSDAKALAVTTRPGERVSLNLADGTRIVLAPLSTLRVPAESQYGTGAREVELAGQALFEVRHNEARPFIVRTPNASVEDIGTTFTVREGESDSVVVRVTVGSVRLRSRATASTEVTLAAGDVGVLHADRITALRGGVTQRDTAWAQGALEFRDAPMNEVKEQLRRWYGVRLRVADSVLETRHVTATLDDEPVDRALQIIALALGAEIERQGDSAVVHLPREATRSR
jgi:transmembrane sensor